MAWKRVTQDLLFDSNSNSNSLRTTGLSNVNWMSGPSGDGKEVKKGPSDWPETTNSCMLHTRLDPHPCTSGRFRSCPNGNWILCRSRFRSYWVSFSISKNSSSCPPDPMKSTHGWYDSLLRSNNTGEWEIVRKLSIRSNSICRIRAPLVKKAIYWQQKRLLTESHPSLQSFSSQDNEVVQIMNSVARSPILTKSVLATIIFLMPGSGCSTIRGVSLWFATSLATKS